MRGIQDKVKRKSLYENYRERADIIILQETHSTVDSEVIWRSEWGGDIIFNHGTTAARGVMVLLKKGFLKQCSSIYKCDDGRVIIFDYEENDVVITIVALYAPNQDTPVFFRSIRERIKTRSENKVIIGDFNLVLDVELDRKNTYNNNNKSLEEVQNIMDEFCMVDIWRVQNQERKEFSWFKRGQGLTKASRLDFALISQGIDQKVKSPTYLPSVMSDHRPLYLLVDLNYCERGTGYWKLNVEYLKQKEYVDSINSEIETTLDTCCGKTAKQTWETLKSRIKKQTVRYARNCTSQSKVIIASLNEKVNEYQANMPLDRSDDDMFHRTLLDLEDKLMEQTKGMIFRSKVKWHELGEKNTKYFFSLEKARYNAKTCFKMINENGDEITNSMDILQEQRSFYETLYSVDKQVCFTMQNTFGVKVSEENRMIQELPITAEELEEAIKGMNNNKTPGEDGIPVDFYKVFWGKLKESFIAMMEEVYTTGVLHQSARKGVLNLIPKAGKDTRFVKNLRPITLLNTDYKIIEKSIANKMIPSLKEIIHRDQRGFMKDRRISVNIRKMLDIIHCAEMEDLEAVVMSLDFVKCFDKCSFSILHGSLDFFGFGGIVQEWTRILYRDFTVRVQNNGHFSSDINIEKGVHQGGCCSSIYFLVIAEILALSLRANEEIEGITLQDIRNILNQFADDMDIFSMCNETSIKAIYEELDRFKLQSGFTVSYEKTTLYRIGSLRHSNAQLYNMNEFIWSNEDINVLGVTIAHDNITDKNYDVLITKTHEAIDRWYNRGLTLMGKVQVVNTLVASLFVYKMMVLPYMPIRTIKKVDNMIRNYLWNGKKSKVSYRILQNSKAEGGLNLVNLKHKDISLKATWPQILYKEEEYAEIVYGILRCSVIKKDIWRVNLDKKDINNMKVKSEFWRDVMLSWSEYTQRAGTRIENQIIWYNSNIRVKNRPIMWNDIYLNGLVYVHQLFEDQKLKTFQRVREEYGLSQLRYNSIISALPKTWKIFFLGTPAILFNPIPPHHYDQAIMVFTKGLSRRIYKLLQEDILGIHNKFIKWKVDFGQEYTQDLHTFGREHLYVYKVTNIPKLRSFQYRLLQRAIVTNVQLQKWGIVENSLCYFCGLHEETIPHLMWNCRVVYDLWLEVLEFLLQSFKDEVHLSLTRVIFNRLSPRANSVANLVCVITKQFIYRVRCMNKTKSLHFPTGVKERNNGCWKYRKIYSY